MDNEKHFSPEESLQLITSMIRQTKESVADNSFYFLFWGWLSFVACMGEYLLAEVFHYPYHYYIWLLMPLGGIVTGIYQWKHETKQQVRTVLSDAIGHLWSGLGILFIVLIFVNIKIGWQHAFIFYILIYAVGTFVTGRMMKFQPLVWGGISNFIIAILAANYTMVHQSFFAAIALLLSYIIPGHLLKAQFKKQQLLWKKSQ